MTAMANSVNYRVNNFDFILLCAATFVIVSHDFRLNRVPYDPYYSSTLHGTLSEIGVNTFFTISGLLVTRSWDGAPNVFRFALRRILRIVPGLAVVTLLCTFVIRPLVATLLREEYFASPLIQYILPDVFTNILLSEVINGSLWTMAVEAPMCIGIAALGTLGFLRWLFFRVLRLKPHARRKIAPHQTPVLSMPLAAMTVAKASAIPLQAVGYGEIGVPQTTAAFGTTS